MQHWETHGYQIAAPALFRYEIVAVTRKSVYRGIFTAEEALANREKLMVYPVRLFMDDDLLKREYELATKYNRPTAYDSQYLAVAEKLDCEFWTADERFFNAVKHDLKWVNWLGNFSA